MKEKIKLRFFAEKPIILPKNVGMKMGGATPWTMLIR